MGNNIEQLRRERDISQEALAEAVGISTLAIEQYEKERWQPGMDVLAKLADYFQVSVADVVGNCYIIDDAASGSQIVLRNTNGCSIQVVGKLCGKATKTA